MWPVHLSVEQNWATGFSGFSSVDNIFTKKCSLGLTETSHQIKKKRQRQKRPLTLKHLLSAFSKQKVSHFCFKTTCYSASHNVFKKVKKQPYKLNALFWFEILFFFMFWFFPFPFHWENEKKNCLRSPLQLQVTLTTFFPRFFSSACKLKNHRGHSLLGSLLSFLLQSVLSQRKWEIHFTR